MTADRLEVARRFVIGVGWLALAYLLASPVAQALVSVLTALASDIKDPIGFGGVR